MHSDVAVKHPQRPGRLMAQRTLRSGNQSCQFAMIGLLFFLGAVRPVQTGYITPHSRRNEAQG